MTASLLSMAKDLVLALIQTGQATPDNINSLLQTTYNDLLKLHHLEQSNLTTEGIPTPAVDWKQSITRHTVMCLECGAMFKQLSRKHLSQHNLDAQSYRAKYGIPRNQPLVALETQARRRKIAQQVKPWEKASQRHSNP